MKFEYQVKREVTDMEYGKVIIIVMVVNVITVLVFKKKYKKYLVKSDEYDELVLKNVIAEVNQLLSMTEFLENIINGSIQNNFTDI